MALTAHRSHFPVSFLLVKNTHTYNLSQSEKPILSPFPCQGQCVISTSRPLLAVGFLFCFYKVWSVLMYDELIQLLLSGFKV